MVQIFTFLHLHFFALIQEVAIKITNILQKQEEKKTANYIILIELKVKCAQWPKELRLSSWSLN